MKAALLIALACGTLLAQPPRGPMFPWWDSPIAGHLNLSDDQKQQIRRAVSDHRSRLIDLRAAVEKAEASLEELYAEDRVDQQRASEAIDRLVSARGQMMREVSQMTLKLRQILTLEQWRELERRRPRESMGPGPGPRGRMRD